MATRVAKHMGQSAEQVDASRRNLTCPQGQLHKAVSRMLSRKHSSFQDLGLEKSRKQAGLTFLKALHFAKVLLQQALAAGEAAECTVPFSLADKFDSRIPDVTSQGHAIAESQTKSPKCEFQKAAEVRPPRQA